VKIEARAAERDAVLTAARTSVGLLKRFLAA